MLTNGSHSQICLNGNKQVEVGRGKEIGIEEEIVATNNNHRSFDSVNIIYINFIDKPS